MFLRFGILSSSTRGGGGRGKGVGALGYFGPASGTGMGLQIP